MLSQYTTLFSKVSYQHPSDAGQAKAEAQCHYLYRQLKQLSENFEDLYRDNRKNPHAAALKRFDQLLITGTRTKAIHYGEKLAAQGKCALLGDNTRQRLIKILNAEDGTGIPAGVFTVTVDFHASYERERISLEEKVNLAFKAATYNDFSRLIYSLANSKSFLILKQFLDKQSPQILWQLRHLLHYAFYKAVHFGDEEMVCYLLNHGVDANEIHCGHSEGMIMPLVLVLHDLECCIMRMEAALQAARAGDHTLGTEADLRKLFSDRLLSYKFMINALLDKGADADKAGNYYFAHNQTPRERALTLLDVKIPQLEDSQYLVKEYTNQIVKLLKKVADARDIADYEPEAIAAEPVEKKARI